MATATMRKNVGGSNPAEWIIDNLRKGLNTLVSETRVDPEETPDALNVNYTEDGLATKRGGTLTHRNTIGARIRGLASYYTDAGNRYFIATAGGTIYYDNGASWTQIEHASGATLSTDRDVDFVQARNDLYLHNGINPMIKISNTTMSVPANGVVSSFGIYWKGRHIVAGNPTYPSRIFISRVDDASHFITTGTDPTAEWFDVAASDGDKLTGLAVFYDNLIILKERSIHKATPANSSTGDFISYVSTLNRSIGCVSHRTIDAVDNDIYFLSRKGVFVLGNEPNFFDTIRTNELSVKVHSEIEGITPNNFNKASAFYHNYRYYLAYPFGGTTHNNRVLAFDTRYGAWSKHRGYSPNCFNAFIDSNNEEKLYCGSDDSGRVLQMETGYSDDGEPIDAHIKSAALDLKAPDVTKFFMDMTLQMRNTQALLDVDILIDGEVYKSHSFNVGIAGQSNGLGVDILAQDILGLAGTQDISLETTSNILKRFRVKKRGRTIQVKVSNRSATDNFTLMSLRGTYRPLSHFVFQSKDKL